MLRRERGVRVFHRLPAVVVHIAGALAERLRVAEHLPDVLELRAGNDDQILSDRELIYAVDVQRAEEQQIHHLADLAVVAVFGVPKCINSLFT